MIEELEFDPEFQPGAVAREQREQRWATKLEAVTTNIDQAIEKYDYPRGRQSLSEQERFEMLGMDDAELQKAAPAPVRPAIRKAPLTALVKFRSAEVTEPLARAYRCLQKKYDHAATVSEAMRSSYQLFEEFFSADEAQLIAKAIEALDVTVFLRLLNAGMQRSAV
ncbi:MAG: hypothetical protein LAN83_07295 [Acidobacteriia bacterium]|nr:hypothetical protein [Terriglobia bacterium]